MCVRSCTMLFASQHSLIIRSKKSGGAIAPLAPLFCRPCNGILLSIYIYVLSILFYCMYHEQDGCIVLWNLTVHLHIRTYIIVLSILSYYTMDKYYGILLYIYVHTYMYIILLSLWGTSLKMLHDTHVIKEHAK